MEPILDETSLVACAVVTPSERIFRLARVLQALDTIGAPRVLRSVQDAADRDLSGGRGLRAWCFDPATNRDAGRLLATRLASQPYIDGVDGLFAAAEGSRIAEARIDGMRVFGLGLAAMTDGVATRLASASVISAQCVDVQLLYLDDDREQTESSSVLCLVDGSDVDSHRKSLQQKVEDAVENGQALLNRANELFPRLMLGSRARDQIAALTGAEPVFRQVLRHMRALDSGAAAWDEGTSFTPGGISFSAESQPTLDDGKLGPMRDFPTPQGFQHERWSLHTKMTGGNGARLYFRAVRHDGAGLILIGYCGDHLPTVKHRT